MIKTTEICNNCYKEYIPKRRGVQKFCSNSCRSRHYQKKQATKTPIKQENNNLEPAPTEKKESLSLAGIGNAAIGTLTVDKISNLLTHPDNKAATKGDIKKLISLLKGNHLFRIKNKPPDAFGRYPYYDLVTESVVYLNI